jgi:hypothetical protein
MLLPLVVFASSFAHDLMRCRVTGTIVMTCACPDAEAPTGPTVGQQGCCERQVIEAISTGREEASPVVVPVPILVAARIEPPVRRLPIGRLSAAAKFSPIGPSLVLIKQSFLI